MICSKCGYKNLEDAKFCENCGSNLSQHYETTIKANLNARSKNKLIIIIVSAILLITTVIVGSLIVLGGNLAPRTNEFLVSGEKYTNRLSSNLIKSSTLIRTMLMLI